ncbi:MAG: HAMP domain-containing histidine kinase [Azoarcus sp.]|jgi:signal transduction histidine kinase|nr:HAMP domain-containing histidine kinase [Azoarcus sp.]
MTTERRQPFARRIVAAFTLMTFVVSGALSLCLVYVVHYIEKELVSQTLDRMLVRILNEDLRQGKAPHLDHDMQFFASGRPEYAIPPEFAEAETGFSEMGEKNAFWVYTREVAGQRYLLVQDQQEFEEHEQALFATLFAGFLLTVAGAWSLGRLTAKTVMSPVRRLAEQVRRLPQPPLPAPLAQDYADDEVGHLAAAFDDALQRLNLAMERERLFTSDVSHELRTPLMIVATSCELLAAGELSARGREQVERIARAADEMRALVETFLSLARARPDETGAEATFLEGGIGLAQAAEEQRLRWQPAIQGKGLAFEFVEEGIDPGHYNTAFLRTVLGNLLRNALHYTEHGWIRLVLEEGGFRVEDSGIGVPEADRERIFQAFTRSSRTRGAGLGLGLSLVKRICAHQGWRVTLAPLPGGGSRFHVRFRQEHAEP